MINVRGKEILEKLGSAQLLINETFPRFYPTCFAGKKAREIFDLSKIRADPSCSNIFDLDK